jgi:glycosyltransferase involved in cell wall biosynthesis
LICGTKLIGLGGLAGSLCHVPKIISIVRGQGVPATSKWIGAVYWMERIVSLLGTRFITVSDYNRQEMIKNRVCSPNRIMTIHNGTDTSQYTPRQDNRLRERMGIPEDAFVIGMVGRFFPQKRYDLFIEYMQLLCRKYERVYGLLIGDGEEREILQQRIDQTGFSDRILITGFIQEMMEVYPALDVSVLFTQYEGCSNALLESAAAGLPIIAENLCGNPEIVHHGKNGFIINPGDIQKAATYTETLLGVPQIYLSMSEYSRKLALQCFDKVHQVQKLIEAIQHWPNQQISSVSNSVETAVKVPQG